MQTQKKTLREKRKTLLKLFLTTLYISAFTFGGGFVIVTFMKRKFVDELHWIDDQEMLDLAALAQSSPGAIAVNASLMVEEGVGYALCLDKLINTSGDSGLCFRPLAGQAPAGMDLVWKKYQVFSKAAERFLEVLREQAELSRATGN